MGTPNFHAEVRTLLRDRLLDAATDITCAEGWDSVTMSRIAERVGVSRQSVYKQIGSKDRLAEAVVTRETDRFLAGVSDHLHAHGSDAESGITAAVEYTLRTGADNPLIKAIVSAPQGTTDGLLPLLTARPEPVLQRAVEAVLADTRALYTDIEPAPGELDALIDAVVRLTLSHLTQPHGSIEHAVDRIRWLTRRVLAATHNTASEADSRTSTSEH
ncbi:TetR family transcriptional regulator [Halopolyspora algeriensis]|uniref:TetR family transcriptional regulator n=1 Tax=Halopolyspora algeriensis TaxID=1500506 RepID=A0A368VS09_9ACTN|nr:TetR family transcriptional regulator [Halopolyspora algeriensis]RCW44489.1 TetR family transcriptional regulator [Halopolyspora algeriensis]TQM55850.1 TetR family transcriptional regulator [Halopolyspora algeriensis]